MGSVCLCKPKKEEEKELVKEPTPARKTVNQAPSQGAEESDRVQLRGQNHPYRAESAGKGENSKNQDLPKIEQKKPRNVMPSKKRMEKKPSRKVLEDGGEEEDSVKPKTPQNDPLAEYSNSFRTNADEPSGPGINIAVLTDLPNIPSEMAQNAIKRQKGKIEILESKSKKSKKIGPYFYRDTGETYQGQYEARKRHGYGRTVYLDGSAHFGFWERDSKHGKGLAIDSAGGVYNGAWMSGEMKGG